MRYLLLAILVTASQVAAYLHRPVRQTGTKCSTTGMKASDTACCGKLYKYTYSNSYVYYQYQKSEKEQTGQCCRENCTNGSPAKYGLSQKELDDSYPGSCYCDDTAASCHTVVTTPAPDPNTVGRQKADASDCCGRLYKYTYPTYSYYYYAATPHEKNKSCGRVNQMPYNTFVHSSNWTGLPGECYCSSSVTSCFNETATTTTTPEPTTTTTLEPTTTTTPEPTTTTPEPTTTTTSEPTTTTPEPTTTTTPEPTTTTPEPTTTTTPEPTTTTPEPTTTTTPEPTTTTPEPTTTTAEPTTSTTLASLCPVVPTFSARVIGGEPVDPCTVDGALQFSNNVNQLCNGVYVYDLNGPFPVPVVYMPSFCKSMLDSLDSANITTFGQSTGTYDNITFDPQDDVVDSQAVNTHIDALLLMPGKLDEASCQKPACVYDSSTMSSHINFDDCYVASFGSDAVSSSGISNSGSLNKVPLKKSTSCGELSSPELECFEAQTPGAYSCQGDMGAPVYCVLDTRDTVLYGMLDDGSTCDSDINTFTVVPI